MSGDNIHNLPTDSNEVSSDELKIVNTIFKEHTSSITKVLGEMKGSIIIAGLFIFFSLPIFDSFIHKVAPVTKTSTVFLLFVKMILFMIVYYILVNFALTKTISKI